MTEQPFMKFEIREKVKHFKDNVSFRTLTTVEMHPIVNVYDSRDKVDISGHLVVNGEFNQVTVQNNWEEQYEQSDGLHYGEMFSEQEQFETFQYQIPLSIQIQQDRITDVDQVFVLVDHFDYEVVSDEEIEVVAHVKVLGIHPDIKQESPVEYYSYDDESTAQQDNGYSHFTTLNKEENELVSYETEESSEESSSSSKESSVNYNNSTEDAQETDLNVDDSKEVEEVDNVIPFPVEAVAEPTDVAPVVEEEENQPPKMKIGFKSKSHEDKQEATSENPLYSLIKKEKKVNLEEQEVQQVQEVDDVQEVQEEVLSKGDSLAEINDELTENDDEDKNLEEDNQETQAENKQDVVAEEVSSEADNPATKKMLFSLLKGNEEKRVKVKMVIVQKDDTLELIAEKYNVKEYDLIQYNRLESNQINDGQILYIPVKA